MLDLIETNMVYKLPRLDREKIQKMLKINDVEPKQTRFYQDVFAEGQLEGEARLIVRLFTRRFGPPDADAVEHIRNLGIAELEALGDALLDFAGPDDLRGWLQKRAE